MLVPFLLFLTSAVVCVVAVLLPGWAELLLIAAPCAVASLILLLRGAVGGAWRAGSRKPRTVQRTAPKTARKPRAILVDGSNVLYWKDGTPHLDTLREVIAHLTRLGYAPGVVFDANAGYLIAGKYHDDRAMAAMIGLPEERVLVVPKGSTADPVLLKTARDLGARIVTNDRYRDWAETHPEVREPGYLIKGAYRDDGLWIDLEERAG